MRSRSPLVSIASQFRDRPKEELAEALEDMSDEEVVALMYDWTGVWARDSQQPPPGEWAIWLVMTGRGFGKTRIGAEWIIDGARRGMRFMRIIARTAADIRDTCIEGESGIIACCAPDFYPKYEPSKKRITWPNGAIANLYAAETPESLRGPQSERDWFDELAACPRGGESLDMALLGLRLGKDPRMVITTTPRPKKVIRDLVADPTCRVTGGSTYENLDNLAPAFRSRILSKYEGTATGEQELQGRLLEQTPGALWDRSMINPHRVRVAPEFIRSAVALDPNVKNNPDSDEAGIVWGGSDNRKPAHFYVCGDSSTHKGPAVWPRLTVDCWSSNSLDNIVYESNQGGDLVRDALRNYWEKSPHTGALPTREVHATRGKRVRAEPIVMLYEQGRVHHVGMHADLEDELANWVPGDALSPGRLDALVWLVTHLSSGHVPAAGPADTSQTSRYRR